MFLGQPTGVAHGGGSRQHRKAAWAFCATKDGSAARWTSVKTTLQEKLWHSGRWLHVIAGRGKGDEYINLQVIYGIASNPTLNREMWKPVICYFSGLGNASQIIFTNANFDFDALTKIPRAPLTALADGSLVDADLAHSQIHGTQCVSRYIHIDGFSLRIDVLLLDPRHAGSITRVEEVKEHGLPGHMAVQYTLDLSEGGQNVETKPVQPPPPRGTMRTYPKYAARCCKKQKRSGKHCSRQTQKWMSSRSTRPGWPKT